ncbi:uncharacterized protein LOC125179543 [Hyalella azteca]|uniref:Uncharacterized protein LOC125179543 n=1 Tax=Hyalella azteca TaxID=294128 RepID=A0A979FWD3_HYAAZ|nr:uncharacterized protein LOC125179543 [Hyalella azteca]
MVMGDISHTDISASESEKKKGLTGSTHFSGSGVSQLVQEQHTFQVTNRSQVPGVNRVESSSDESDHIEGDRLSDLARPLTSRTGLLARKIENPSNSSCTCCPDHKQDIFASHPPLVENPNWTG